MAIKDVAGKLICQNVGGNRDVAGNVANVHCQQKCALIEILLVIRENYLRF